MTKQWQTHLIRGAVHAVSDGCIVELWLGWPNEAESEYITSFDLHYIDSVIAALVAIKQIVRKQ